MTFAYKVKERRGELGLKVTALAELTGYPTYVIYDIERGKKTNASESMFAAICEALELDPNEARTEYTDFEVTEDGKQPRKAAARKAAKPKEEKRAEKPRVDTDAVALFIAAIHAFAVELNDDGRAVAMETMRTLSKLECFKGNGGYV